VTELEQRIHDAWTAGDHEAAATALVSGYGPEILRYLVSLTRDADAAGDAFSQFCETVWTALPKFRGDASFRVWAYAIARSARHRLLRDPLHKPNRVALSGVPSVELAAANVRSQAPAYANSEVHDKLAELRAAMAPDDQALLILRVNREMAWTDIVHALAEPDDELDAAEVTRRAAALRKRFQRIKDELRGALTE